MQIVIENIMNGKRSTVDADGFKEMAHKYKKNFKIVNEVKPPTEIVVTNTHTQRRN